MFWSAKRRNALAHEAGLSVVPELYRGRINLERLVNLLTTTKSKFSASLMEGVILRRDNNDWCELRGKLVRPEFLQAIEHHWSRGEPRWNQLKVGGK
jgi:hypothetical protein